MISRIDYFLLFDIISLLGVATLLIGLVIVTKAVQAYRQSADRGMLLLGGGLLLLVVVAEMISFIGGHLIEPPTIEEVAVLQFVVQSCRLIGISAILTSIYVRS